MAGAGNNVIINADDFNNAVDVINEISTTLFETKKELEDINSGITINKEELSNKLDVLDSYLTKVSLIQKQVLGDKSIDKQYQLMTQKINKNFEDAIKKIESNFEEKEKIIDKKIENLKTDAGKIIEIGKEAIGKDKEKIKNFLKQVQEQLNVASIGSHAIALTNSANAIAEAVAEQNKLRKSGIRPFLSGVFLSSIFFGIAIYLNSIMHFF